MSTAHTPGPWVAFGLVSPGPKEEVGYWCPGPGAWTCVANCSHEATGNGGAPGELEANARLIAAAPDLLAALRDLLPLAECYVRDNKSHGDRLETALAAIAKAVHS